MKSKDWAMGWAAPGLGFPGPLEGKKTRTKSLEKPDLERKTLPASQIHGMSSTNYRTLRRPWPPPSRFWPPF